MFPPQLDLRKKMINAGNIENKGVEVAVERYSLVIYRKRVPMGYSVELVKE